MTDQIWSNPQTFQCPYKQGLGCPAAVQCGAHQEVCLAMADELCEAVAAQIGADEAYYYAGQLRVARLQPKEIRSLGR